MGIYYGPALKKLLLKNSKALWGVSIPVAFFPTRRLNIPSSSKETGMPPPWTASSNQCQHQHATPNWFNAPRMPPRHGLKYIESSQKIRGKFGGAVNGFLTFFFFFSQINLFWGDSSVQVRVNVTIRKKDLSFPAQNPFHQGVTF